MLCFRSWFSGFVDGEGSFLIVKAHSTGHKYLCYTPVLCISLRIDDADILEKIKDNLQLGGLSFFKKQRSTHGDICRFRVSGVKQCQKLISIFDMYPLQSKKYKDYLVWKDFILRKIEFGTKLPRSLAEYYYNRIKEVRQYSKTSDEVLFRRQASHRKDQVGKISL